MGAKATTNYGKEKLKQEQLEQFAILPLDRSFKMITDAQNI